MGLKLTREGAYGYISVLIARSPSLVTLSNIVESDEVIDIQTAVSRGILGSEYLVLIQANSIDDVEEGLNNFYKHLLTEVLRFVPKPYDDYVDCFIEIFDLDKVISLMFSAEKQKLKLKHSMSRIESLASYILHSNNISDEKPISFYTSCLNINKEPVILNTIKCFMRVYVERVVDKLNSIGKLEPVDNSLKVFYEFSLLRLYRYIASSRLLRIYGAKPEDLAREIRIPSSIISKIIEDIKKLDEYLRKDLTLYTVYELKSVYGNLRSLLYTPHSFVDRLTYFLVHKFYESMFIRYTALHRYTWR